MRIKLVQNIINKFKEPKPQIGFLVFWIGTKCTLKCKLCCNLIPYLNQVSYNTNEILKDIEFLVKNSKIRKIQLQGGEPFTHPDIIKILDFVSKLKVKNIDLATNGTIKLKEDVLEALKRNSKIKVRISNYSCTKDLREKFCKVLEEKEIPYRLYDFFLNDNTWFSTGGVNEERADDIKVKEIYKNCEDKNCHTLADGIYTICGKVPAIKELYNDCSYKKYDEIDVRKLRKSLNPFKKYILRRYLRKFNENKLIYKEQCRYCNISGEKYPAAEQLTIEDIKTFKNGK